MMAQEGMERDWKWREGQLTSHSGPGFHLITKLMGVMETNKYPQLQRLNSSEGQPFRKIRTAAAAFGNGDIQTAAEALLRIVVFQCCNLEERYRIAGLNAAIVAAQKLVSMFPN